MPATAEPRRSEPITPAWHPLRPHPVQSAAWRSTARQVTMPGGRRGGKTELAKRRLVRFLPVNRAQKLFEQTHGEVGAWKDHFYGYLCPTRPQAKRVAWNHLKALVPRDWLLGRPYESDLIIRCRFKDHRAELHVLGMDRPERSEGNPWDGLVVDESSDQPADLDVSIRPALADHQGWEWDIGVPKRQGKGAPNYRRKCERGLRGDDPNCATFSWPSWDILPADEVERLRNDLDEKDFLEQIGGQWQDIGGSAFYAFDEDANTRKVSYDPSRPIFVASDFNVDPMAWGLSHVTKDGAALETFDELWLQNTNTQRTLDVLYNKYGTHPTGFFFYGDAASKQRHTSASSSDYAQILNDKRFNARVSYPDANPPVKDRLSSCNALLRNAAGLVRWHIDKGCVHLISDLKNRGLDEHGMPVEADKKTGGHITDAVGYLIHARWPSTYVEHEQKAEFGIYAGD